MASRRRLNHTDHTAHNNIKRDGKPVAALVDARLVERIRRMQVRFDALCRRIEAGYAAVPEADGLAEIDAAVAETRAGR